MYNKQINSVDAPLAADLDYIYRHLEPLWEQLRNQRIFITGGTGFFGCWFLESFLWVNDKLDLNASITLLTREQSRFAKKYPHLCYQPAVTLYEGDIRNFTFLDEEFSYVIHAATDSSMYLDGAELVFAWDAIVGGTRHVLDFARHCNAKNFLFTSSGAIYGRQSPDLTHFSESSICQPQIGDLKATYAVGKFASEHLCTLYAHQYNIDVKIARCFTFVGPYISLESNFAMTNFINSALKGECITIKGDGTPYRSYLYAADLMVWLWTILFKGKTSYPYNVGSDKAISIKETAYLVAECFQSLPEIKILTPPDPDKQPERYVPDVRRAKDELGLAEGFNLADAIKSTINWYNYLGRFNGNQGK